MSELIAFFAGWFAMMFLWCKTDYKVVFAAYHKGKADATPKWISISECLPEEKINPNTSDFEEVLCSTTFGDVRVYKFGTPYGWKEPHFWRGLNVMDEYVKAWIPKPEIPKEMK